LLSSNLFSLKIIFQNCFFIIIKNLFTFHDNFITHKTFSFFSRPRAEYEISTEENFFRSGVLRVNVNGTSMDVKFYVNKNGFHVADLQKVGAPQPLNVQQQNRLTGVQRPFGPSVQPQRGSQVPQQNFRQPQQPTRFLQPTFSRPDQLTQPPQSGR
jgi:hypothetical protein